MAEESECGTSEPLDISVTVHTSMSREVFFVSFACKSHGKPEECSAKLRFLQFVCIAKRVIVHGVNSNIYLFSNTKAVENTGFMR